MNTVSTIDVSVVIPTFRRPEMLRQCLDACCAQSFWQQASGEILVVDNSPEGGARAVVAAMPDAPVPLRFVHEARPGISHARNTGLAAAQGELIAFIDDDNIPAENWLERLVDGRRALNADAVFGRVVSLPNAPCTEQQAGLAVLYERDLGHTPRLVTDERAVLGAGNSLFLRECFPAPDCFDPALGLTGGEDTAVLTRMAAEGRNLGWLPDAVVLEMVPLNRLTQKSLRHRRFRNGIIRVRYGLDEARRGSMHRLVWMGLGTAQSVIYTLLATSLTMLGLKARADLAWGGVFGGLGKVMWWRDLQVSYGQEPASSARPGKAA